MVIPKNRYCGACIMHGIRLTTEEYTTVVGANMRFGYRQNTRNIIMEA